MKPRAGSEAAWTPPEVARAGHVTAPVLFHQAQAASEPKRPGSVPEGEEEAPEGEEEAPEQSRVRDLLVTVDSPESHVSAMETFISYRLLTQVRDAGPAPCGDAGPAPCGDSGPASCPRRPPAGSLAAASTGSVGATRTSCGCGAAWRRPAPP